MSRKSKSPDPKLWSLGRFLLRYVELGRALYDVSRKPTYEELMSDKVRHERHVAANTYAYTKLRDELGATYDHHLRDFVPCAADFDIEIPLAHIRKAVERYL